jgi:hypothetical protein
MPLVLIEETPALLAGSKRWNNTLKASDKLKPSRSRLRDSRVVNDRPYVETFYGKDLTEFQHEENRKQKSIENWRRQKYQFLILVQAYIKLYLLSCVMLTSVIYEIVQKDIDHSIKFDIGTYFIENNNKNQTLCIAFLVTGNIMDNAKGSEKKVIVALEFALSFALLIWGISCKLIVIDPSRIILLDSSAATEVLHLISYVTYMLGGAVLMITAV